MVYLKDLAQGLVHDAPQTPGGSTEGTQRLQEQARETEKEYEEVTDKVRTDGRVSGPDNQPLVSPRSAVNLVFKHQHLGFRLNIFSVIVVVPRKISRYLKYLL